MFVIKKEKVETAIILVDPSIKGPGGHHFEYAARIVDAAKKQNIKIFVFANRNINPTDLPCEYKPAFSADFWQNYNYYYSEYRKSVSKSSLVFRFYSAARGWITKVGSRLARWVLFSDAGYTLVRVREEGVVYLLFRGGAADRIAGSRVSILGLFLGLLGYPIYALSLVLRKSGFLRKSKNGLRLMIFFGAAAFSAAGLRRVLGLNSGDPAVRFANEFSNAFRRIKFGSTRVVVFVPNATAAEIVGYRYLCEHGQCSNTDWAFLYRREIFRGLPSEFPAQSERARAVRVEIGSLVCGGVVRRARFYTDTKQLTDQYNFLGVAPFETMPVPVAYDQINSLDSLGETAVVNITYLGDARDEKGFDLLPTVVEYYVASNALPPRSLNGKWRQCRFSFQSNFNVPGGEPKSRVAKQILAGYPDLVNLMEGPFSSPDYSRLLLQSDIVVVPYDADSYGARSSGVFYEAVAAGKPVVVPAKTSMAFLAESVRLERLQQALVFGVKIDTSSSLEFDLEGEIFRIPNQATHVAIDVTTTDGLENWMTFATVQIDESEKSERLEKSMFPVVNQISSCLVRLLPSSRKIWAKVGLTAADTQVRIKEVKLTFYRADRNLSQFSGVGVFFDRLDFSTVVFEMVATIEWQRQGVELLKTRIAKHYSPETLVDLLLEERAAGSI
jgi:hypothetical protein